MKEAMNIKHDRIGLKTILSGLSDPFGQMLRSQRPQTIEDATSILAEEENLQYLKSFRQMSVRDVIQKPSQIVPKNFQSDFKTTSKQCTYCHTKGHTAQECYKKRNQLAKQVSPASTTPNQNTTQYNGGYKRPTVTVPTNRQYGASQHGRPSVIQRQHNMNHLNYQTEEELIDLPSQIKDHDEEEEEEEGDEETEEQLE